MKKLVSVALAFALVAISSQAQAADVEISGGFTITADVAKLGEADTTLKAYEEVEVALDVDMGGDVLGHVSVVIPGGQQFGSDLTTDITPTLEAAYLEFPLAMLYIRAGLQGYALPGNVGAATIDDDYGAFVIGADLDMIAPEFVWAIADYTGTERENIFALTAAISLGDMVITPFGAVNTYKANNTADLVTQMYFGADLEMELNAMFAGAGATFGTTDGGSVLLVEAHAAMDLGSVVPGIAAWYGTTTDAGVATAGSWGGFNGAADYAFGNAHGLQEGFQFAHAADPFNSLGVMVSLSDIALSDSLALGGRVVYALDSSDAGTGSDLEVGAALTASITDSLDLILEGAYIMNMPDAGDSTNNMGAALTFAASF